MTTHRQHGGANVLADLLSDKGRLVADGGMGTSLFELGLRPGETPEVWNVENPDGVAMVHSGFVDAGSDIILTNTFGGTRARLDLDRQGHRVEELNSAAVAIGRRVASRTDRQIIVAGSVGPTGMLFEPLGELTHADAVELFREQMTALAGAGADVLWIETLSSTEELAAAVEATGGLDLPVVTTMSFDTNGRTMMGVPPQALPQWWASASSTPTAIGANCGVGPADVVRAVGEIRDADDTIAAIAKANCGIPKVIDGELWYPASSDDMYTFAELALDAGARIVGGCCGSVPDHIRQIRKVVDTYEPSDHFDPDAVSSRLGDATPPPRREPAQRRQRRRRPRV